jgi:tetratricopeptide (TPR) repeat protein
MAAIGFTLALPLVGLGPVAHAAVSAEVGKHLQAAQDFMKKGKYKEAMAKVNDADRAGGKTATDSYTIEGMRASIATSMGDKATATHAYEALLASGKVPGGDQSNYVKAIAGNYYSMKDYPRAITWINRYLKEGGTDPQMRALLTQTQFLTGNCAQVVKDIQNDLRNAEKSGRPLGEDQLQILANCANKQNDKVAYVNAIEKLTFAYPKKDYWADLLNRVQGKPGFSSRLTLDLYRLKVSVGQLKDAPKFMEMAQLSLQAGSPAEAMRIIDTGYKVGALGTGPEAERHKRLKDLASKALADDEKRLPAAQADALKAKDMDALFTVGFALSQAGQHDKGLPLMEQALQGTLKHPDDARLHLGLCYQLAGKKADAIKTLKTVGGTDGASDLARYWVAQINKPFTG